MKTLAIVGVVFIIALTTLAIKQLISEPIAAYSCISIIAALCFIAFIRKKLKG